VWWADLPPPSGRRPVVLLSRDEAYSLREFVIMSPITTRRRGLSTEVSLGPEEGLPKSCVANLDVIITGPKASLKERIGVLSSAKLRAVEASMRFALGLED